MNLVATPSKTQSSYKNKYNVAKKQTLVVRRLDNAIHRINRFRVDK